MQKLKFKVEMRKENTKDNFIQVYEGKNNNCLIEKLNLGKNYEFSICSIYEDSFLIGALYKMLKLSLQIVKY